MKKLVLFGLLFCSLLGFSQTEKSLEVVFVLDRSGSMEGLEPETIGGFNSLLEKQKEKKGAETFITTVLFDHEYSFLHNRASIADVKPITKKEYFARGMTALLDAIGKTIIEVKSKKPENSDVLFVIITDGQENSSKEFRISQIKEMIEQQQKEGWEFLFLGANIDAISEAGKIGISSSNAVKYEASKDGTTKNYEVLEEVIYEKKAGRKVKENWKEKIEKK